MWPYLVYGMHLLAHLMPPVCWPLFRSDFLTLVVLVEVLGVGPDACPSSFAFSSSSSGNSKAIGTTGSWIGQELALVSFFKQDLLKKQCQIKWDCTTLSSWRRLFLWLLHGQMICSRPKHTQCFFTAATNFLTCPRKPKSLLTLGIL